MSIRITTLVCLLFVGCTPSSSPAPSTSSVATDLASKVGQEVTLRGRFDGPGKLANYIITNGEQVYLTGDSQPDANSIKYGTEVVVRGKLQHYVPPPADTSPPDPNEDRTAVTMCPEHYFIESAKLVGVP